MNNKFGTDRRYRETREPFWRGSEADRALRSPDQEFETSSNYREPPDDYAERGRGSGGEAGEPDWSRTRYNQFGRYAGQPAEPTGGFKGRGPKGYFRTDDRIREDVCERLSWNDELDATEIHVRVENGDVILDGNVETRHMKRLAEDLAERVPGVIDVHNGLRVHRGVGESAREPSPASVRPVSRSAQAR